jgi:hypothetical protein
MKWQSSTKGKLRKRRGYLPSFAPSCKKLGNVCFSSEVGSLGRRPPLSITVPPSGVWTYQTSQKFWEPVLQDHGEGFLHPRETYKRKFSDLSVRPIATHLLLTSTSAVLDVLLHGITQIPIFKSSESLILMLFEVWFLHYSIYFQTFLREYRNSPVNCWVSGIFFPCL